MDFQKELEALGLKDSEIRVYLYLLSQGIATPPEVARGTSIARPNCYAVLASLKEKGLISEQQKGKRKAFSPNDPSVLVHTMQMRTEAMNRLLPDLRALFSKQKNKPSIRFFEGPEQMKEIFIEMLEAKEVLGVASTKKLYAALTPAFFKSYIQDMHRKGITLRDILTRDSVPTAAPTPIKTLGTAYRYRVLPKEVEDVPVDILVWGDKVAFLSVESPIFGTLLENAAIAKMMKVLFELSWERLGPKA